MVQVSVHVDGDRERVRVLLTLENGDQAIPAPREGTTQGEARKLCKADRARERGKDGNAKRIFASGSKNQYRHQYQHRSALSCVRAAQAITFDVGSAPSVDLPLMCAGAVLNATTKWPRPRRMLCVVRTRGAAGRSVGRSPLRPSGASNVLSHPPFATVSAP